MPLVATSALLDSYLFVTDLNFVLNAVTFLKLQWMDATFFSFFFNDFMKTIEKDGLF